ncbi:ERI1 exoribonuclease 2 isoform X2 [Ranitomeya variabilis]
MTTKELAKQLGLIRRSSKLSLKAKNSSSPKTNQFFDYLIVIDFESTCWKDTKCYGQEIIEFPAVLLNTTRGEIESEFHTYVQPQEHPVLSDFCTELTGIKQQQVDDGVPLKICLSQFSTWIQKLQKERHIIFPGVLPTPTSSEQKMCGFVTWSDWDLGVCLLYECRRKQLRKPDILNSWIDLRLTYKLFYNRKPKGLNGALQDVGIEFSGREHSGLDDSRNTARLAWRMISDGCVMKITKSLDQAPPKSSVRPGPPSAAQVHKSRQGDVKQASAIAKDDGQDLKDDKTNNLKSCQLRDDANQDSAKQLKDVPPHQTLINGLSTTLGNDNKYRFPIRTSLSPVNYGIQIGAFSSTPLDRSLYNRSHVLMSTTVHTVNDCSDLDMDSCSDLSILAEWEEAAVIEDSQHEGPAKMEEQDLLPVDSPSSAVLMLRNNQENQNSCQSMHNIRTGNLHRKSVIYQSPDTTIYNVNMKKPASNGSAFKLPSALGSRRSFPAPSTGEPRRSVPAPSTGVPRRSVPAPSTEEPRRSVPAPSIGEPRRTVPAPSIGEPTRTVPVPSTGEPRRTVPAPSIGEPRRSIPVPSTGEPRRSVPAPSTGEPRRSIPVPSTGEPRRSVPAPSTGEPRRSVPAPLTGHRRKSVPSPTTGQPSRMPTVLDYFPKRKLANVSFSSPPKKLPFTIYEGNRTLPVPTNGSHVLSNAGLSSTNKLNKTIGATKWDRITAPTCQCGRRAKKLTVSNMGPNHGRVFYSCSVRKRNDENGKGCNYFKWEDTLLKEKTSNASACLSTSLLSAGFSAAHKPFFKLRPSMRT